MNMNFDAGTVLKAADMVGNVVKYHADKKSESLRYHDDALKEMNQLDNSSKTERVGMVLAAITPLIMAGACFLKKNAEKDEEDI